MESGSPGPVQSGSVRVASWRRHHFSCSWSEGASRAVVPWLYGDWRLSWMKIWGPWRPSLAHRNQPEGAKGMEGPGTPEGDETQALSESLSSAHCSSMPRVTGEYPQDADAAVLGGGPGLLMPIILKGMMGGGPQEAPRTVTPAPAQPPSGPGQGCCPCQDALLRSDSMAGRGCMGTMPHYPHHRTAHLAICPRVPYGDPIAIPRAWVDFLLPLLSHLRAQPPGEPQPQSDTGTLTLLTLMLMTFTLTLLTLLTLTLLTHTPHNPAHHIHIHTSDSSHSHYSYFSHSSHSSHSLSSHSDSCSYTHTPHTHAPLTHILYSSHSHSSLFTLTLLTLFTFTFLMLLTHIRIIQRAPAFLVATFICGRCILSPIPVT